MRSRWLLLADAVLIVLVAVAIRLVAVWRERPPAAPPPASTGATSESAPAGTPAPPTTRAPLSAYAGVGERNLFSPARTETPPEPSRAATTPAGTAPAAAKPRLWGVLLGVDSGRAYLEDPPTRKVFPYKIGDTIADSRSEQIQADRVVLRRGAETYAVLLRDPSKPKPPAQPVPARTPGAPAVPVTPLEPRTTPAPGVLAPVVPGAGIGGPTGEAPGRTVPRVPRRLFPEPGRPVPAPPQPAPDAEEGE